jgi:hypothetical protein
LRYAGIGRSDPVWDPLDDGSSVGASALICVCVFALRRFPVLPTLDPDNPKSLAHRCRRLINCTFKERTEERKAAISFVFVAML